MSCLREITVVLLVVLASFMAGCVMRNSVEVSGGFFDSELQRNK
ncbi:MAG: hypothetical protein ACRESK_07455 [Gammaproteobacteria bacterium]